MNKNQPTIPSDPKISSNGWSRPRISVRALMGLVLVIGVGLGWYIHKTQEQRSAVQAILARNGIVEYDYKYDAAGNRRLPNGKSWSPVWLQKVLGDDNFVHHAAVVGLDMDKAGNRVDPTDADLAHLERLRHIKVLYLGGGRITDDGLGHLKNLTELRMLIAWGNPISGAGLKHLRGLKQLRHLDLSNTAVTDE